jgi:hypothetical protein
MEANLDKLKNKLDGKETKIEDIFELVSIMHHRFMKEYGYIPLKEFMEMPLGTFMCLIEHISNDAKAMKNMRIKKYG